MVGSSDRPAMVAHHPDAEHPAFVPELHTAQQHLQHLPLFAKELLAGGVAGGLAKTSVAPLERCKILFQTGRMHGRGVGDTLREIYQSEGARGFFRGNGASVLRIVPYAAVHFTAYERFRELLLEAAEGFYRGQEAEAARVITDAQGSSAEGSAPSAAAAQPHHHRVSPVLDLLAGSAAGATAVLLTYPLDLVRTRLAYGMDAGPSGGGARTAAAAGAAAVAMPQQAGAAAADAAKGSSSSSSSSSSTAIAAGHSRGPASGQAPRSSPVGQERPRSSAGSGAGSGSGSGGGGGTSGSNGSSSSSHQHRLTIRQVLRDTLRAEGATGLYRGIGPTVIGILPYAGLKFYVYQSAKQQYRTATGQADDQRLPVPLMLTFGAASGLIAQTVTYPLDVVRRRMQVQALAAAGAPRLSNTWGALRAIAASQGWRGLFSGLSINYMKVVPSTAIGFTLYDSAKQFLGLKGNI